MTPHREHLPAQVVAEALRRATLHTDELLAAELPVTGGDTVQIVCVSDVEDWLRGLAARVEQGEKLKAPPVTGP